MAVFMERIVRNKNEVIEQGSASYYFSHTANIYMKELDPLNIISHGESMGGSMIRARKKCYFIQIDRNVQCPDYVIGHATMRKGTSEKTLCAAAKKATTAPLGCQRKHCTPCAYDLP